MKIRIDLPHHPYDIQIEKDACLKQENGCANLAPQKIVIINGTV